MRRRTIAILTAGLFAAACACGTVPSDQTEARVPTTTAMTKATYVKDANAICKKMNEKSAELEAAMRADSRATNSDLAEALAQYADLIQASANQLRALPMPAGDEAALTAIYDDVDALADLGRRASDATKTGDKATAQALGEQGTELQDKANAAANAYGLTECGKSS